MTPLLHIGFHKTATTFLQQSVFAKSELGYCPIMTAAQATEYFILCHERRFDPNAIRAEIAPILGGDAQGLVPVVSHEALSGNFAAGLVMVRDTPRRLRAVFPDARVIIGVREQRSLIRSLYGQYIMDGGIHSIEEFLGAAVPRPGFRPPCDLERFEFDLTVSTYQEVFGPSNVLVLPFELLLRDRRAYLERIREFSGASPVHSQAMPGPERNVGIGSWAYGLRRRLNRIVDRPPSTRGDRASLPLAYKLSDSALRRVDASLPASLRRMGDRRLRERVALRIGDSYAESNRRLAALTGLPLAELGYPG